MAINTIDAAMLKKCFLAGAANLEAKKEIINELNVFPVPDGDTGTNMTMTILSAAKEVSAISTPNFENLSKAISGGSLRGARGNSGVILSQLFRGFTKEIKTVTVIDAPVLARAFQKATETAYKAVMKPKEGTILTVAKGLADKMNELACENGDIEEILGQVLEHGRYVLSQTPEMLPVLKEAGVVDSGGQGLIEVISGIYDCLLGKEIDLTAALGETGKAKVDADAVQEEIKFGYCTEFIINVEKKFDNGDELNFKAYLESIGDSIVVVADEDIVKVHVHTNDPGLAIQKALTYGSLSKMKIDNMREEHKEKLIKEAEKLEAEKKAAEEKKEKPAEPKKKYGFISVSAGAGLSEIFEGLGVDVVIEGGQTMNPSTEDMLNAIDKVNAENVFILPNNSNIILAANQAQSIVTDKNVYVVPSKTIPQGITALINFDETADADVNLENMSSEMKNVKTGQVTYAVRDTSMDGKEIKQNDIMGIGDKTILSVGKDVERTTIDMLAQLIDDDSELISVYYGEDVTMEQVDSLTAKLEEAYPDLDLEVHSGGQPIYYYIVSVE